MEFYWIDSNIFIEAANGPYTFSRAPGYWSFLDKNLASGVICTSEMVYRELVSFGDDLSKWVKNRKQKGLFEEADATVQVKLRVVVDYVSQCGRYDAPNINEFLSGADPWIIAHAMAHGGTVVTNESALRPTAKKVRIPDICNNFGVRCIGGYDMLDELQAVF
jgi:hypothetical protein